MSGFGFGGIILSSLLPDTNLVIVLPEIQTISVARAFILFQIKIGVDFSYLLLGFFLIGNKYVI